MEFETKLQLKALGKATVRALNFIEFTVLPDFQSVNLKPNRQY